MLVTQDDDKHVLFLLDTERQLIVLGGPSACLLSKPNESVNAAEVIAPCARSVMLDPQAGPWRNGLWLLLKKAECNIQDWRLS